MGWPHAGLREANPTRFPLEMSNLSSSPSSGASIDPGGPNKAKASNRETLCLYRDLEIKLQSSSVPPSIPAARVPSYASRFKASLRNLRKISDPTLLEDGTPVIQAPESVLLQTSELWKDHVVAHFHGRRPSAEKIIVDLNPVWGKFGRITVRTVSDTCVLILIPSVQTREWVLQVGYWQADQCAFSVYPWSADGNLVAEELLFAPTWAVLKNVPPQLYSLDGISVVASGIGEPLHTEKSRLDPYHFGDTKVKVENYLSHSPPEVVEVSDSQGNVVRVKVEYPSLPPKCINCGKFGHLMNRCHKPLMKKAFTQKKEAVISVVKCKEDVSLVEPSQEVEKDGPIVQEDKKKSRARSRSRRRSHSRAKVRALSSPPEVLSSVVKVHQSEVVVTEAQNTSLSNKNREVIGAVKAVEGEVSDRSLAVVGSQLEEGEIGAVTEIVDGDQAEQKEEVLAQIPEESSIWLTKHSKGYRRTVRQVERWKDSGYVGSPPKSYQFLLRCNSLDKKIEC